MNVLYVGMMWDILSVLDMVPNVDNIYVIDDVDLSYGTFIKGKKKFIRNIKRKN